MNIEESRLLYVCDFPPSNLRGGTVLISRLLQSYPMSDLVLFTGSYFDSVSPKEGRLPCRQIIFPTTNETGRFGLGRIKSLIDWLAIPIITICGLWLVRSNRIKAIVTIAHGHFFIAAALISRISGAPLILMVHDDWVAGMMKGSLVLRYFCAPVFGWAVKIAAHGVDVRGYLNRPSQNGGAEVP